MVGILHVASRPGGVEILLAASCFRNLDKLRQLWASLGSKASLQLSCRTGVIFGVSFRRTEASAKRESRARGGVRIRLFCRLTAKLFQNNILQNFAKWPFCKTFCKMAVELSRPTSLWVSSFAEWCLPVQLKLYGFPSPGMLASWEGKLIILAFVRFAGDEATPSWNRYPQRYAESTNQIFWRGKADCEVNQPLYRLVGVSFATFWVVT